MHVGLIGMDQARDTLLYGKAPGDKNPFKDLRVRRALYHAIDIETLKNKLSEYIRAAAAGETVLVTDRGKVVAEITPPRTPPPSAAPPSRS